MVNKNELAYFTDELIFRNSVRTEKILRSEKLKLKLNKISVKVKETKEKIMLLIIILFGLVWVLFV